MTTKLEDVPRSLIIIDAVDEVAKHAILSQYVEIFQLSPAGLGEAIRRLLEIEDDFHNGIMVYPNTSKHDLQEQMMHTLVDEMYILPHYQGPITQEMELPFSVFVQTMIVFIESMYAKWVQEYPAPLNFPPSTYGKISIVSGNWTPRNVH